MSKKSYTIIYYDAKTKNEVERKSNVSFAWLKRERERNGLWMSMQRGWISGFGNKPVFGRMMGRIGPSHPLVAVIVENNVNV